MSEYNAKTIIKKLKKDKITVNEVIQLLKNNEIVNDDLDLLYEITEKLSKTDTSSELIDDLIEVYKNNTPKKQSLSKEKNILIDICNIINKSSTEEKTNKQIQLVKTIKERESTKNELVLYATLIRKTDNIEVIEKLTEQINSNDVLSKYEYLIEKLTDKINDYIINNINEKKDYDKEKVKNIQKTLTEIIHKNDFDSFELLNNISKNNNNHNPDLIADICEKFNKRTRKEKKIAKIGVGLYALPCLLGILTALPSILIGTGVANIALMLPFTISMGYLIKKDNQFECTINNMIDYFNKQRNGNNKDGLANLQSQIIDMAINLNNYKVMDNVLNNMDFNTKNIGEDFKKIERLYNSKNNLKVLYQKGIDAVKQGKGNKTEEYFLQKLKDYNNPAQKKSSRFIKETKALIISLGTNDNYNNFSPIFQNEFNKAIQNIINNKKLLLFGLDKETYNLAKDLTTLQTEMINSSTSESDEEKKPLIDKSKEDKNISIERKQNTNSDDIDEQTLLLHLSGAADNISAINNTQDLPLLNGL